MTFPWPRAGLLLLVAACAQAQHAPPSAPAAAQKGPAKPGRMTDADAEALARQALGTENPAAGGAALAKLKGHTFRSSAAPERELVLYAQGVLEARQGNLAAASVALKKLERQWPRSPFMGEAQSILAEDAVRQKRYKEAESRLHKALASDIPSERKRRPQELLISLLAEQGRPGEALPIVQSLRPLEGNQRPSEEGLAGITQVFCAVGEREQAEAARHDFLQLYPASGLRPKVDLAWGALLGRTGEAKGAAEVFRKLIKDHPKAPEADDARLALANLLTDRNLPDTRDLPSAESLLAEVRRGGKGLPKGTARVVELRLLAEKSLWEEVLNQVERMDSATRESMPEVKKLWTEAWNAWVGQRLEKGFPGELLARLKPGAFAALEPGTRKGVAELLAAHGLLEVLPHLLNEAPGRERAGLRKAALAKVQPESQAKAVLDLLPGKGGTPDEALLRARAEAALGHWTALRGTLLRARPGAERVKGILSLLQRPLGTRETLAQRRSEAEGWLGRLAEKGADREPLAILVGDLRLRAGDARGALAVYPVKAAAPDQRGWLALARAEAMVKLGQRDQARLLIRESRDEQGFKGQRDALAKSLGAY